MTATRRSFLRSGAMTVLLTGLALDSVPLALSQQLSKSDPSRDFQPPFRVQQEPTFHYSKQTFEPYLNGVFTLIAGRNRVEAKLVTIRDFSPTLKRSRAMTRKSRMSESFALVFHAEGKLTDLTSIYDVEHAALGRFALFMTYRAVPKEGSETEEVEHFYEAVFNHVRGSFRPA